MAVYEARIAELFESIDHRNQRIAELFGELKYYTLQDVKLGKDSIIQTMEEAIAFRTLDKLKFEAMVKAFEARFGGQLRENKLEVHIEPAENECKGLEDLLKEVRRVDGRLYTLKHGEITLDEAWFF